MSTQGVPVQKDPSEKPLLQDTKDNHRTTPTTTTSTTSSTTNGHHHNSSSSNNNPSGLHSTSYSNSTGMADDQNLKSMQKLEAQIGRLRMWFWATLATCIAAAIIVIILVTVLYTQLDDSITHHSHKPKVGEQIAAILEREPLCVPCDDYRLGPSPEEERMLRSFTLKDTSTGRSCCVDEPQELVDLMKMFVEKRFRQEMARGTINPWPQTSSSSSSNLAHRPAAHLMMASQNMDGIKQVPGRQFVINTWIHNDDLAFTYFITYRHGRLVIPEDGFYFVYSQISFMEVFDIAHNEGYGSRGSAEFPSLSHYLYRYNVQYHNGGEEKLAQNSITKCWGQSKQYGEYTSYLGAVFKLRNADEIFIKVSNISMVGTDPKLSYFGLYKI